MSCSGHSLAWVASCQARPVWQTETQNQGQLGHVVTYFYNDMMHCVQWLYMYIDGTDTGGTDTELFHLNVISLFSAYKINSNRKQE